MSRKLQSKIILGLVFIVILLGLSLFSVYSRLKGSNYEIKELHVKNNQLSKDIDNAFSIISNNIKEKQLLREERDGFKSQVLFLEKGLKIERRELSKIKGRYKEIEEDSLVKIIKKRYEMDSIRTANTNR